MHMATAAIQMDHSEDPRSVIRQQFAPFADSIQPLGARVLVGVYVRPTKTKGGILLTDKSRDEDVWQGKVGLVLKLGPLAFQNDDSHVFKAPIPEVGDWVMYRVGDTMPFLLGGNQYRYVEDVMVLGILDRPDMVL